MPDKSQAHPDGLFALPDHHVIALSGRDAVAFAQAQFMNDASLIGTGQWQWSGWLTPKGRVLALFALLRLDDETLWLLLPDADPTQLADALRRFVFRSKVAVAVRPDLRVSGRSGAPAAAHGNAFAGTIEGGIELDMGGEGGARGLLILTEAAASAIGPDTAAIARWTVADLSHGLPRLPASQVEHWTPQQLSLERLKAFSVKKGCYPGQEIVARTHFLGKAKRGLMLVEGTRPIAVGSELLTDGASLGPIIASVDAGGRHVALAVTPLERSSAPATVDGSHVNEIPLLAGLAR